MSESAPQSERELLSRAGALAGWSLGEIANAYHFPLPANLSGHKGVIGDLLEHVLGATAMSRPVPDFESLGIELKTVPVNRRGRCAESTHVCTIPARGAIAEQWFTSTVRHKLARVLWVPIELDRTLKIDARRIGAACLWSPSDEDEQILREDWEEHMELIVTGRFGELDARSGTYLQVRPKAANRDALVPVSDESGELAATLPRGFYLRPSFTTRILSDCNTA
jgi:DNA mismatch repair protein MutH